MPVNAQMPMNNAQGVHLYCCTTRTTTMLTEPVYENVAGVPVEPQETLPSEIRAISATRAGKSVLSVFHYFSLAPYQDRILDN